MVRNASHGQLSLRPLVRPMAFRGRRATAPPLGNADSPHYDPDTGRRLWKPGVFVKKSRPLACWEASCVPIASRSRRRTYSESPIFTYAATRAGSIYVAFVIDAWVVSPIDKNDGTGARVGRWQLDPADARGEPAHLSDRVRTMKAKPSTAIQNKTAGAISHHLTRRSLLAAAPALPALPLAAAGLGQPPGPRQEASAQNRPAYKLTPHIEAFYKASRY